jgi:hypothetical protein
MAHEASTTFLRLFMRVLSPALFARKLPDLWGRDHTGGKVTVETTDTTLVCRISEVDGYNNVACISCGWATFALTQMGKSIRGHEISGWSLKNPGPESVAFTLHWSG